MSNKERDAAPDEPRLDEAETPSPAPGEERDHDARDEGTNDDDDAGDEEEEPPRPEEKQVAHVRAFIALEPPIAILRKIARTQAELEDRWEQAHGPRVRWVAVEHAHITLKFLGSIPVPSVDALSDMLDLVGAAARPLKFRVSGIGTFPGGGGTPRVVWVGVEDDGDRGEVARLATAVEAAAQGLGFPTEDRPFTPHLTLGRVKQKRRFDPTEVISGLRQTDFGSMTIRELVLYRSEITSKGARHSSLHRARIGRPKG